MWRWVYVDALFHDLRNKAITAVDINFTDEQMIELNNLSRGIKYQREMPVERVYDLILLLDVIEHIEHDQSFFANLVGRYIPMNGKIMQSLLFNPFMADMMLSYAITGVTV